MTAHATAFNLSDTNERIARRQKFDVLSAQMKNERTSFESHWRELGEFIKPRRTRFLTTRANRGERRTKKIIDSTATTASDILSTGMMNGVTNPSKKWFRLSTGDTDLDQVADVKEWLDAVSQTMFTILLRSNLYQSLPIMYRDIGIFATAAVFIQEDFDTVIRSFPQPLGSFWIAQNQNLEVDTFFREFRMTVRQLVDKFGREGRSTDVDDIDWSNISIHVRNLWNQNTKEVWIDVCHMIRPNDRFDPNKLEAKFKSFSSTYYERGTTGPQTGAGHFTVDQDKFLQESGFDFFPVLVPRWEVAGEDVYGTDCPGMTALGDIKQLQLMEKRLMQAIEKMVNPPMKGPTNLRTSNPSILPGKITYANEMDNRGGFRPVHEVDPRIQELEAKSEQTRVRIRKVFHENTFQALTGSTRREITAREVEEIAEEKLSIIGGVLQRLNEDALDPLIDILFLFMLAQDLVPDPPEEMQGLDLKVEYISVLHQAQKLTGLAGIERLVGFAIQVFGVDPSVFDKIDVDQLIMTYADITGVPPEIILSDEEVAELRDQRQKAEAAAQELQLAEQGARTARDLSQAKLGEGSALDALADAAAGGELQAP